MSRRQRRQPLLPLVVCRQGCPRLKGLIASRHLMPPGPCGSWKLLSTSVPASAAAMGAVPRCRLWLCGATATRQHWRPTADIPDTFSDSSVVTSDLMSDGIELVVLANPAHCQGTAELEAIRALATRPPLPPSPPSHPRRHLLHRQGARQRTTAPV